MDSATPLKKRRIETNNQIQVLGKSDSIFSINTVQPIVNTADLKIKLPKKKDLKNLQKSHKSTESTSKYDNHINMENQVFSEDNVLFNEINLTFPSNDNIGSNSQEMLKEITLNEFDFSLNNTIDSYALENLERIDNESLFEGLLNGLDVSLNSDDIDSDIQKTLEKIDNESILENLTLDAKGNEPCIPLNVDINSGAKKILEKNNFSQRLKPVIKSIHPFHKRVVTLRKHKESENKLIHEKPTEEDLNKFTDFEPQYQIQNFPVIPGEISDYNDSLNTIKDKNYAHNLVDNPNLKYGLSQNSIDTSYENISTISCETCIQSNNDKSFSEESIEKYKGNSKDFGKNIQYSDVIKSLMKDWQSMFNYNHEGYFGIHQAVLENNLNQVRRYLLILEHSGSDIDVCSANNMTALELGVQKMVRIDIIKLLLNKGANPVYGVHSTKHRNSAITIAAKKEEWEIFILLLNYVHEDDGYLLNSRDSDGLAAIHYCVFYGNLEALNALLNYNINVIDVNLKDSKCRKTALVLAVENYVSCKANPNRAEIFAQIILILVNSKADSSIHFFSTKNLFDIFPHTQPTPPYEPLPLESDVRYALEKANCLEKGRSWKNQNQRKPSKSRET